MNNFVVFRAETGLTVREFAHNFKIPLRTVQDWNNGKRACKPYILDLLREKWRNMSKSV